MTMVQPTRIREQKVYEFETVSVNKPAHSLVGILRSTWRTSVSVSVLALLAGLFLLTPLLQTRAQVVGARELAAQFDTARGALGLSDLSPLPNEPVATGSAIAALSIPKIGLSQVVFEGADGATLQHGPGHISGTAGIGERGISAIAGRRATWGSPFAKLASLKPGDTVRTTTVAGTLTYKVTQVTSQAPDFREATGTASRLVLVTSAPAGIAASDVYVLADSTAPAFPTTPQNRLSESGIRGGSLAEVPVAVFWILAMITFAGLARLWTLGRTMDKLLAWSTAAPIIVLCAVMALRALTQALPATL